MPEARLDEIFGFPAYQLILERGRLQVAFFLQGHGDEVASPFLVAGKAQEGAEEADGVVRQLLLQADQGDIEVSGGIIPLQLLDLAEGLLGIAVAVHNQVEATDAGPDLAVAGVGAQDAAIHGQGPAVLVFPFQGDPQVEHGRDELGVHGEDPEEFFFRIRQAVGFQVNAAQVVVTHDQCGVQAQEFLDGANGFGIPPLLGVEGGQEEAGFPVFRV